MATGIYLIDHPPVRAQYRSPRREQPSGVVVVHTAESFPDETGPDTGAENVAVFIRGRSNAGSYHDLADSDSAIQLVRYSDEAFGDATGSNPHAYHVSAATQAAKWLTVGEDWARRTVRNMAGCAARYATWLHTQRGILIPARRITRAQSEDRVPGFISHAERDPKRRRDPGADFDWDLLLDDYTEIMEGDMDLTDRIRLFTRGEVEYSSPTTDVEHVLASTNYYTLVVRNRVLASQALLEQLVAAQGPDDLTPEKVRAIIDDGLAAARAADAQAIADLLTPVIEALDDTQDKETVKAALREVLTEGVGG